MDDLVGIVADAPLAVVILASWVVSLHREKSKFVDKLMLCVDELRLTKATSMSQVSREKREAFTP